MYKNYLVISYLSFWKILYLISRTIDKLKATMHQIHHSNSDSQSKISEEIYVIAPKNKGIPLLDGKLVFEMVCNTKLTTAGVVSESSWPLLAVTLDVGSVSVPHFESWVFSYLHHFVWTLGCERWDWEVLERYRRNHQHYIEEHLFSRKIISC